MAAKVLLAPPRINLRRAASDNSSQDRHAAPLSSTSSRFNFNHLFFSPPPSPSLPALVPRPKRSSSQIIVSRPSRTFRLLFYLAILATTTCLVGRLFWNQDLRDTLKSWPIAYPHSDVSSFEMVEQDALPDFPTPIVAGHGHRMRWTVSIPPGSDFPLSVEEYQGMGSRCQEVSAHARELQGKAHLPDAGRGTFEYSHGTSQDPFYMDVDEAERAGLLAHAPVRVDRARTRARGRFVGLDWEAMAGMPVCRTSLTYVLESPDAGLGTAVMNMWMAYGLARRLERAFFVDDSRWAYGTYSDIFQTPRIPDCRPPPRHQMVSCPAQAKHLVVSSVTLADVLPGLVAQQYDQSADSKDLKDLKDSKYRVHDLFQLARIGHDALFQMNSEDSRYVAHRVKQLREKAKQAGSPVIGLHIRHGDRHPLEYQYQDTYIPSQVFLDRAQYLAEVYHNSTGEKGESPSETSVQEAITVVASDDPLVLKQPEFADSLRAQERIVLSIKESHDQEKQDPHVLHPFKEEEFGWEGGFFASMFWNLGTGRKNNAGAWVKRGDAGELTHRLRSYIGRAYMMDLAVLAGASDNVVCGVSTTGCRMLGVMLGWEGVEGGRWVNVDGDYGWGWMT